MTELEQLQFPIGKHVYTNSITPQEIQEYIGVLTHFPSWVESTITNLDAAQLFTPYRDGGWNIHEVIHHCADSHMNCLLRLKLALTENNPTICPYDEAAWATCADYQLPLNYATTILHAIHPKLVALFASLTVEQWQRTYYHPGYKQTFNMMGLLHLYAWHCRHHFAHIQGLKQRMAW
jgi:DinB superfamily